VYTNNNELEIPASRTVGYCKQTTKLSDCSSIKDYDTNAINIVINRIRIDFLNFLFLMSLNTISSFIFFFLS